MGLILAVTTPVARKGLTFTCPRRSLSGSPGGRALEAGFFVFAFGVFFMVGGQPVLAFVSFYLNQCCPGEAECETQTPL